MPRPVTRGRRHSRSWRLASPNSREPVLNLRGPRVPRRLALSPKRLTCPAQTPDAGTRNPGVSIFPAARRVRPDALSKQARRAHEAGFDSLWVSEHFHAWNDEQGSKPVHLGPHVFATVSVHAICGMSGSFLSGQLHPFRRRCIGGRRAGGSAQAGCRGSSTTTGVAPRVGPGIDPRKRPARGIQRGR
jgi:hypothetical protein